MPCPILNVSFNIHDVLKREFDTRTRITMDLGRGGLGVIRLLAIVIVVFIIV